MSGTILFRRVREGKKDAFAEHYAASWHDRVTAEWIESKNMGSFVVPELHQFWTTSKLPAVLGDYARVTKGFDFRSADDPKYPSGAVTDAATKLSDKFQKGFKNVRGEPLTHLIPQLRWLNTDERIINAKRGGTTTGIPQVLQAYSPADRDPWRHKAYIDKEGRRATSRFLLIRPHHPGLTLECVWAICHSPIANAFTFARTTKRDITVGKLQQIPMPVELLDLQPLHDAVCRYLTAARDYTAKVPSKIKAKSKRAQDTKNDQLGQMPLALEGIPSGEELAAGRDRLRALHWRVDAEVLKLYALPPERERELLDFFDKVPRVGVPFVQEKGKEGYIPQDFRDVQTLDEYLRITDEWDATNAQRHALLDLEYAGTISREQSAQLEKLQRLLMLRQRRFAPISSERIDTLLARMEEAKPYRAK